MKIIRGKYAGFCPGVRRAWNLVEKSISRRNGEIFILGELIHNKQAVEKLNQLGVKTIKSLEDLRNGSGEIFIRAHGEPPSTYQKLARKKNLKITDATCPSVSRVQKLALNLEKEGFQVIICGEKDHPEALATVGYTQHGLIIETTEEVEKLPFFPKIGVVSQTTFSPETCQKICNILENKTSTFKFLGTICNFVKMAQKEAKEIASSADLVIIVGGKQSSNTKRLAEIASSLVSTYHIETADEIKKAWFLNVEKLGLLAGASTPEWVINEVIEKVNSYD